MATVKISSKVEETEWRALQALARESQQSVSHLLTEAIRQYVSRRNLRPEVVEHLEQSIEENRELGRRLAE